MLLNVPGARTIKMAQNHSPVDEVGAKSDKTDNVTSIDVAQARINSSISYVGYDGLSAVGAIRRPAKSQENRDAWKEPDRCWIICERRDCDSRIRTVDLQQQRANADQAASTTRIHRLRRSGFAQGFSRMGLCWIAAHAQRA